MRSLTLVALLAGCCPAAVFAQDIAQRVLPSNPEDSLDDDDEDADSGAGDGREIVVVASRLKGEVDTPQQPVATFDEEEIAAYGAASINELLESISPQTGSGRGRGEGRPVILLNGQRISSFREMRSIPPEAIRRLQVFPEEVALKFGYPPNQRVVNIILKDNFSSKQVAGELNLPTRGGYSNYELEGSQFRIAGQKRITLEAKITDTSMLTEAERKVRQEPGTLPTVPGDPEPGRYRSLAGSSRDITVGGTVATGIGQDGIGGALTVNGAYTRSDGKSYSGLNTVDLTAPDGATAVRTLDGALTRRTSSDTLEAGLGYNKNLSGWQLTGTVNATYAEATTEVDRRAELAGLQAAAAAGTLSITGPLPPVPNPGFDTARSKDTGVSALLTAAGNVVRLPAGDAAVTVRAGFDYNRSDNEDTRNALGAVVLDRSTASAGVNVSVPLTSKREDVLGAIGDVSLNFSGGLEHLSDFGTLTDWSAGVTWNPTSKLGFQASYIVEEAAPSLSQLGSPSVLSYNVSTYDFTRGETALVTVVTGGNADLVSEKQRDIKLSMNWQLPLLERSNLVIEYFRNRSSDVTQAFPLLTPAIEAAFPGRVTRLGPGGPLVQIDRRPVTFHEIASSRMRWGFNFGGRLGGDASQGREGGARGGPMGMMGQALGGPGGGGPPPGAPAAGPAREGAGVAGNSARSGGGPRSGAGGGGPGFGGAGGGRGGSRWNLSVYHTWRFTDTVQIARGGPVLNQLEGGAIAAGGVPRHAIEFEGGLFKNGYGLRLKGEWNAPARVDGSGLPGSSDLRFGSTLNLDLRMFVNLGQQPSLVEKVPFFRNARLAFTVDNLLDQRQRVTDQNGQVPLAYQAAFREPQGRVVGLDFRKLF